MTGGVHLFDLAAAAQVPACHVDERGVVMKQGGERVHVGLVPAAASPAVTSPTMSWALALGMARAYRLCDG
jgi:hypothetical protein